MKKVDIEKKGFLTFEEFEMEVESNKVNTNQYMKLKKDNDNVKFLRLEKFKSVVTEDSEHECLSRQMKNEGSETSCNFSVRAWQETI